MPKCYLVIDDDWHSFSVEWLHGAAVHRTVLHLFQEVEEENLHNVDIAPGAPWKSIEVTMVVMMDSGPYVWVQYFGTHQQILQEMHIKCQQWRHQE